MIQTAPQSLGPSLPMAEFASTEIWNPQRIDTLAVYCSDGRWGESFDEFCHKRLLIPRYDRWAVPGGPAWLVARQPGLQQVARDQIGFLVRAHELGQIVLITHFACAYYAQALHRDAESCLDEQLADLRHAAQNLHEWFPDLTLATFLAMRAGNCVTFHRYDPGLAADIDQQDAEAIEFAVAEVRRRDRELARRQAGLP